jgi:hypothetical protein
MRSWFAQVADAAVAKKSVRLTEHCEFNSIFKYGSVVSSNARWSSTAALICGLGQTPSQKSGPFSVDMMLKASRLSLMGRGYIEVTAIAGSENNHKP